MEDSFPSRCHFGTHLNEAVLGFTSGEQTDRTYSFVRILIRECSSLLKAIGL